jgi:hypothetical protein
MIELSRHVSTICAQITFVARHAVSSGYRAEDAQTIAAMREIAATLRSSADLFERQCQQREASAQSRTERNAMLYREPEVR